MFWAFRIFWRNLAALGSIRPWCSFFSVTFSSWCTTTRWGTSPRCTGTTSPPNSCAGDGGKKLKFPFGERRVWQIRHTSPFFFVCPRRWHFLLFGTNRRKLEQTGVNRIKPKIFSKNPVFSRKVLTKSRNMIIFALGNPARFQFAAWHPKIPPDPEALPFYLAKFLRYNL